LQCICPTRRALGPTSRDYENTEFGERGDYERRAALSRERAALVQRIAHAERVGG